VTCMLLDDAHEVFLPVPSRSTTRSIEAELEATATTSRIILIIIVVVLKYRCILKSMYT